MKTKIPPPAITLVLALLMLLSHYAYPLVLGTSILRAISALLCLALAVVFLSESLLSFMRHKTTILPFEPEKATSLVVSGVYKLSRNPMYLGMLLLLLALMLYLGNPALVLILLVYVLVLTKLQIQPEEQVLKKNFGADYEAYCRKVRRWI